MAKVMGSVDDRGRPVVRIEAGDGLLLVIDTGFNGDLMITRAAATAIGVTPVSREMDVELGDGSIGRVHQGRVQLPWLGEDRAVRVLVSNAWTTTGDEPVGLIGTELLTPHLLLIDFAARTVEIATQGV